MRDRAASQMARAGGRRPGVDARWGQPFGTALLVASLLFGTVASVCGQTPALAPANQGSLTVTEVLTTRARIGDRIRLRVDGLSAEIEAGRVKPRELVLYLDGHSVKGVTADVVSQNVLEFTIKRTADSRDALDALLGSPTQSTRKVLVSAGPLDKQAFMVAPAAQDTFELVIFQPNWFIGGVIGLGIIVLLFFWLATTSNIIRDSGPPRLPPGARKPYSLARFQAVVWFFLVVGSFLFIYLITGDYNTITEQALVLIGIGTGTALGAALIDASKQTTADDQVAAQTSNRDKLAAEITELEAKIAGLATKEAAGTATPAEVQEVSTTRVALATKQGELAGVAKLIADAQAGLSKPVSEGFLSDMLSDVNGINFHRFQMLVWTLVLSFIFCLGVYRSLAMPKFDTTLLALMGISAGTYLGFKIPERQT